MVPVQTQSREAEAAPAWLADAATGKPAYPGERMRAAIAAVHLGDITRRAVLQCIAYRDGPGGPRPAVSEIAQVLGLSDATVHRHLNALRQADAAWWRQSRGANRYVLNWPLILSHPCEGLEAVNSRTGARVYEAETLANEAGNPRKFDDKPSHSFARGTGINREPEAIAAAAVSHQATGGGGGNRANMEPEARPLPPPAVNAPAGSGREPEREPEARQRRPRHTTTFSAAAEMQERFGHLREGSEEWKRAVDDAGMDRDRTAAEAAEYRIRRTRQLIETYSNSNRPAHKRTADRLRRELAEMEAAARPANARQGSRGAGEAVTNPETEIPE